MIYFPAVPEIQRPYGDHCKNCPLSIESERLALILTNGDQGFEVTSIRQKCGWTLWRKRMAGIDTVRTVKSNSGFRSSRIMDVIGSAPENCPLPY